MAPETLAPSPFPPLSSEPSFPPASSLPPRKSGLRSAARCPVARFSLRSSVSPMPIPSLSTQEGPSIPLRIPPLPSSTLAIVSPRLPTLPPSPFAHVLPSLDVAAPTPSHSGPRSPCGTSSTSVPGGCSSGLVSLPARADSCPLDGFPCLDELVLGVDLGVFDGEGTGIHVGAQNGVRFGIRSSPVKGNEPCVAIAVNCQHFGPPDSLVLDLPAGIQMPTDSIAVLSAGLPAAAPGSLKANPSSIVGMLPSDLSVDYGSLGSQLARPIPSPISDASMVANLAAQIPVIGPHPAASSSPSCASIVGQQHDQGQSPLPFFSHSLKEGEDVTPPLEVLQHGEAMWSDTLVGYFYGLCPLWTE